MSDPPLTRRRLLRCGTPAIAALAGCTSPARSGQSTQTGGSDATTAGTDQTTATQDLSELELSGEPLATGLRSPVGVTATSAGRLYIVDQVGVIRRYDDGGLAETPVVDFRDRMVDFSGRSEMGLLGMALHPQFEDNGRVFVRYSAPPDDKTPSGYSHRFVLSELQASEDGTTFDPASEQVLLTIPEPQGNHNAGSVTFGPDSFLYVGVGDGGAGGDQGQGHVDDWYDAVDGGNGQDVTENLLGSILRIDVDGGDPYAIPPDNPLVDSDGLDEQYAWGFRNPWRFSFGPDGRFFVADVGQSRWEEVNVVERGGNYGWNVREGPECFRADTCPETEGEGQPLRDPILSYPHDDAEVSGISVIGGYIYEGVAIPALTGRYVFADFRASGRLFVATEREDSTETGVTPPGDWSVTAVPIDGIAPLVQSFGRDANGELLVCTTRSGGVDEAGGVVARIRAA
ncbi:sugar dehydrogenase [Halobacteriales archaeon QS_4_62_28]|nr:MAG: sugar dehydrogenase [Halobacteriales archaeon QS_4_62_28]